MYPSADGHELDGSAENWRSSGDSLHNPRSQDVAQLAGLALQISSGISLKFINSFSDKRSTTRFIV